MMRALSSGISGLKAHQTAMDVVGNNISNVDTSGFKSSNTIFRDALYQTIESASASGYTSTSDTGAAGVNPSQIGYGANASSININTTAGDFSSTGSNMDCAIDGEGYFVIADGSPDSTTPTQPTSYKYTRLGTFSFDSEGYLTDGTGNRVCGQNNTSTTSGTLGATTTLSPTDYSSDKPQYIHYDVSDTAKNDLKDIAVSSDGTVTATNDGVAVTIGKVALARFQNAAGLTQDGSSFYKVSSNSGDATYAAPGSSGTGSLKTGGLESSNVDLATEFANMITYERGFQANSKIMTVADEMLETLVNMKR